MRAFNAAADWLAGEAFARRTANKIALQKLYYAILRERFGLSTQMAVRCIAQICEAYKRDKGKRPQVEVFRRWMQELGDGQPGSTIRRPVSEATGRRIPARPTRWLGGGSAQDS